MEIERKFLIREMPDLSQCKTRKIAQGYLSTNPVVRVRKDNDEYYLTYKGKGKMVREEYNLPLTEESFKQLIKKADGHIIEKTRYELPYGEYTIELDIFEGHKKGLIMAEVEFPSVEEAESFVAPEWFGEDVTSDRQYHNSNMI